MTLWPTLSMRHESPYSKASDNFSWYGPNSSEWSERAARLCAGKKTVVQWQNRTNIPLAPAAPLFHTLCTNFAATWIVRKCQELAEPAWWSPQPRASSGCGGAASCQSHCSHTKGTPRNCFGEYRNRCNCSKDSTYTIEYHKYHCFDPLSILDTSDRILAAAAHRQVIPPRCFVRRCLLSLKQDAFWFPILLTVAETQLFHVIASLAHVLLCCCVRLHFPGCCWSLKFSSSLHSYRWFFRWFHDLTLPSELSHMFLSIKLTRFARLFSLPLDLPASALAPRDQVASNHSILDPSGTHQHKPECGKGECPRAKARCTRHASHMYT